MPPVLPSDLEPKLCIALVCLLSAVPCSVLGWRDRAGAGRRLSLASLALGIGLPALLFKAALPHLPTVILGNVLTLLAMSLYWHVSARLAGRARPDWTAAVAPALWVIFWLWPPFFHHLDLRIAVASVMTGCLGLLAGLEMTRSAGAGLPGRLLLTLGLTEFLVSAIRFVLAITGSPFGHSALWVLCTELNLLAYVSSWPALCVVLMHRRLMAKEIERGAHDELSGLLNRRGLLGRAARMPDASVLLFDLDRFKRINDSFGHAAGDSTIVAFAALATRLLPRDAVFGRIGGEEFAVLLREGNGVRAREVAEAVRAAFARTMLPIGVRATVSVGVALAQDPTETIEGRLGRADRALYRAKRAGRDRVETWSVADLPEATVDRRGPGPTRTQALDLGREGPDFVRFLSD